MGANGHEPADQPKRNGDGVASGAPLGTSALVGRLDDLAGVAGLLGEHRLVTLTGAPGVGKSRVAYEVAVQSAREVNCGPYWVDLADAAGSAELHRSVGDALGVDGGRALPDAAREVLGTRWALLVLDNTDHVIRECGNIVRSSLAVCPGLRVVVTSRERLDVVGEAVWPILPLPVPDGDAGYAESAVELFAERARAVRPGFVLDEVTIPIVVEICRRLDGLPLAIELAAGRAAVLSPAQILAGLDDHARLLRAGPRTGSVRHRSMETALSWSTDHLGRPEQVLLRRLAVFRAGYTLEAAEAVCAFSDLDPGNLLDALDQLVTRSLVDVDTSGDRARYRLLEVVRHHALGQLRKTDEAPELTGRYADWCVGFAERAELGLAGPDEARWLRRLDAERGNLDGALDWSIRRGRAETAVRLAAALALSFRSSRVEEGKLLLYQLVGLSRTVEPRFQARLLWGLGMLAAVEGRFAAAVAPLRDALALAQDADDRQTGGRTLLLLANCALVLDGPTAALPVARQSLAVARDDDPWCAARALAVCGWAAYLDGEPGQALALAQEAVGVARRSGQLSGAVIALNVLGFVASQVGEPALAQESLTESLELNVGLDGTDSRAISLTNLANLEMARGQFDQAHELLDRALSESSSDGTAWAVIQPLLSLGRLADARADVETAAARFSDVLAVGGAVGFESVQAVEGLSRIAAQRGDDPASARQALRHVLSSAERVGAASVMADALHDLGVLARTIGQHDRAASLHRRALRLRDEMVDRAGIAGSLEALAGVSVDQRRFAQAARLFGAAESIRRASGVPVRPSDVARLQTDLNVLRNALGDRFVPEHRLGEQLSADEAVAAACSRRPSWRPSAGWGSLTNAERDVVALVAEGLTNREVGERLLISRRTVQTHLSHVFAKLGVRSRTELATRASYIESGQAAGEQ